MYPKDGLKGQKAHSPGHRPGLKSGATFALKGQKHSATNNAFAPTGRGLRHLLPRAMPWAKSFLAFQAVNRIHADNQKYNYMKKNYVFQTSWPVRDYECDIEGIVNNAQYLHYCEHTRHLFLQQCGLSFAGLHRQGTDAVVAHMKLWYKVPLRPDDILLSCMNLQKTNAF
jgi:hypothetical protein